MHLIVTTDGEARPNPGKTRIGVIVEDPEGKVIRAISDYSGVGTNNQAEYKAILRGLVEAKDLGASTVTVYTDSQLAERQLRGIYGIKNKELKKVHQQVKDVEETLSRVRYRWHGREEGRGPQADALAKGGEAAAKTMEELCLPE